MRNWKKSLLLAAGLAVLIPSAAMATQKSSEQTDTVTVEVKNVKGGALNVWYNSEYPKHVYLPIGEKVTLPKGTKLYIGAYGGDWNEYFSDDKSADVDCYAKDVIIRNENEKTIEKHMQYSSNATDYIVNDNCTIEAGFTWDIYNAGKGDYVTRSGYTVLQDGDASIDSPGIVYVKLKASKDGKEIPLSEVPGLQFGSKVNNEALPSYIDQFEFTENGIKSKTELPIGYYRIPFCYRWTDEYESFEDGHAGFYVGKMVGVYLPEMARYKSENGEEQYLRHTYSESLTTLKNPNVEDVYTNIYFDAEKFTINDLVKLAKAVDYSKWDEICGYTRTNEFVDSDGNQLNNSNEKISKLKDDMYPVYKNGNKTFKAVTIEKAVPGRIHYYNSVLKENGKRYYVDPDGKIARNGWNGVWGGSDSKVFSGEDGFIVTNGIAGISMDDEEGLWLVKDNGLRDEKFTGTKVIGDYSYTIEKGKVTKIVMINLATPSNAEKLKDFVEYFKQNESAMDEDEQKEYADKISAGFASLSKSEQNKINKKQLEDIDTVLEKAYGVEAKDRVEFFAENDVEKEMVLNREDIKVTSVLAAAGINSNTLGETRQIKITQLAASASNAAASKNEKPVLRFKAELFVNGVKKQINGPVIIEIALPDQFKNTYTKDAYTFVINHVMDDETKENITPEFSDDFTTMTLRANSFSTFELLATKKDSGNTGDDKDDSGNTSGGNTSGGNTSGGNTSGGNTSGGNTSGGNTSGGNTSGGNTSGGNTSGGNTSGGSTSGGSTSGGSSSGGSSSGGSSSGGSSSGKVKTYHAPAQNTEETIGKWQQDKNGWWFRFNNGSWPKSQWVELTWNGTSSWYYFNEKGYMVTSWQKDGNEWYYLNPKSDGTMGAMVTGWKQIDNIWYYFSTVAGGPKGAMLSNTTTPDGYQVGADGAWIH